MMRPTPRSPLRAGASLITPIEPALPGRAQSPATSQQAVQSTPLRRLEAAVASSCGPQHAANEDAHSALDAASSLFVVADGVGGGAMAEVASRELVAHLQAALAGAVPEAASVRRAMLAADRGIAERIARVTAAPGAATVALCAPVNRRASMWLLAWVGDCRIYRVAAGGELTLLSRDDSFGALGESPPPGASLDDPARMVGNGAIHAANVELQPLASGEALLLCSDGVHKHLDAAAWRQGLDPALPLAGRCLALVALARQRGSRDDATAMLVRREAFALPRAPWLARGDGAPDQPRSPQ